MAERKKSEASGADRAQRGRGQAELGLDARGNESWRVDQTLHGIKGWKKGTRVSFQTSSYDGETGGTGQVHT